VYELVAAGLAAFVWLVETMTHGNGGIGVAALLLAPLAFVPYAVVGVMVAWRSRLLAAYTVFPHAALTVPLFMVADRFVVGSGAPIGTMLANLAPVVLAAGAAAAFVWVAPQQRWGSLLGGVVVCQLMLAAGMWLAESSPLLLAPLLIGLGLVILIGPVAGQMLLEGALTFFAYASDESWIGKLRAHVPPVARGFADRVVFVRSDGEANMTEQSLPQTPALPAGSVRQPQSSPTLDRMYKLSVVVLTALIVVGAILYVGRAAVYKIHEYERGLHLRGGRFIGVQNPGWHVQIPLVDTVIIVKVNERLGYVDRIEAMTSDNVTMNVSLQYTYRVTQPEQFALQVDDPERIVFEFVQGKLRDVVNTKAMTAVMNDRALMNQEVMASLKEKEAQYGVQFVTVQMQNASPPDEVMTAIKDRMVAVQRQDQAQAEAAQRQTLADADLYAAQKQADAEAYQITTTAQAEAERIRLTTEAEQLAVRAMMTELADKGVMGEKFIEYLIAQELKDNSKWIINGEGTPIVDLRAGE
jgi:regulator of protease activity HflC (stomatin/prohibitin superfamily)